jgi:hypothetical protein
MSTPARAYEGLLGVSVSVRSNNMATPATHMPMVDLMISRFVIYIDAPNVNERI